MPASLDEIARQLGTDPDALVQFVLDGGRDPVFWCETAFGSKHWEKQREILYAVRDRRTVCVPACHASGKSFVASDLALWWLYNFPAPNIVLTTAPSERQVRRILWAEIRAKHAKARLPLPGVPDLMQLEIGQKHFGLGFATSDYDPTRFQGLHADYILLLMDEACGISLEVYEGAAGILGGGHARFLQLGNPTDPLTQFKRDCDDPRNTVIQISSYDTPNFNVPGYELREKNFTASPSSPDHWTKIFERFRIGPEGSPDYDLPNKHLCTPNFVDDIVRRYGVTSPQYVSRVLGQFPEQAENSLLSITEVRDAMERVDYSQNPEVREAPLVLGVDVARFGSNETVVMGFQGDGEQGMARVLGRWGKTDTFVTATKVNEIVQTCIRHGSPPVEVRVDVIGVGGGVVDSLHHRFPKVPTTAFNSSSREGIPPDYLNVRALAYFQLKERMETRKLDLHDMQKPGELKDQLLSIRWQQPDGSTQKAVLGKEYMRSHGIPSPDDADALMIACYGGPRGRRDVGVTV